MATIGPPIPHWVFVVIVLALLALGLVLGPWLYRRRWYAVTLACIMTFVLYQLTTLYFGHFWALNLAHQYPSFWSGDLILLPFGTLAPLSYMIDHLPKRDVTLRQPYLFNRRWWPFAATGLALVYAVWFWGTQRAIYPPLADDAPWKYLHNVLSVTFISYLIILGSPAIWYWIVEARGSRQHSTKVLVAFIPLVSLFAWGVVATTADRLMDINAPGGHALVQTRDYDWSNGLTGSDVIKRLPGGGWRWVPVPGQ